MDSWRTSALAAQPFIDNCSSYVRKAGSGEHQCRLPSFRFDVMIVRPDINQLQVMIINHAVVNACTIWSSVDMQDIGVPTWV